MANKAAVAAVPVASEPTPGGKPTERWETLQKKARQLHAMLEMTYGNGAENFDTLNPEVRGYYLWACADLAGDCADLTTSLSDAIYNPGQ